ncbi:hypothetical protein IW261DRAFT_1474879 [Armillaria novae-zelandiae]|uniref:Alcohol dehydrogenase-like N-terminal domain-containing protein n=1 Tax=Armillaria novae-zelandiae TaxID=153914 RepID=A0AA39PAW5_9AGAR|nr:hypothetical protein IW261DRAFT_1474879 [Armillaria novae-zelandiae]
MPEGTMKALWYNAPQDFEIKQVPIPKVGDDDVLLKVSCCGVCGTDAHIHDGEFISKFPVRSQSIGQDLPPETCPAYPGT